MIATLLDTEDGLVALEVAQADVERVHAAISELFGPLKGRWFYDSAHLVFGGEGFVFKDLIDTPRITATNARGGEILKALAEKLNA